MLPSPKFQVGKRQALNTQYQMVWGELDRVMPISYAERLCKGIAGAAVINRVPGAGHLAELDAPGAVAEAILDFVR